MISARLGKVELTTEPARKHWSSPLHLSNQFKKLTGKCRYISSFKNPGYGEAEVRSILAEAGYRAEKVTG